MQNTETSKRILHQGDQVNIKVAGQTEPATAFALINRGKTLVVFLDNGMKMKVSSTNGWAWWKPSPPA